MSKSKIRIKPMTLNKFIWYTFKSCKKNNKRMKKKFEDIVDYHVGFISAGGAWMGKQ